MKFYHIKEQLSDLKVFSPKDVYTVDPDFRLPTLYDWESKGLVKKMRNNNYVFSDFKPANHDFYFIANKLYEPSYVSLETALAHYSIIPEVTAAVTSVTSNKTNKFDTPLGTFLYSKISTNFMLGYTAVKTTPPYAIASLEKAILDYLYLTTDISSPQDFSELRWNKDEISKEIDFKKFETLLVIFQNKSLEKRCVYLMEYLNA